MSVDEPLPVTVAGLKTPVAPAGKPVTPNPTLPANPFTGEMVTVKVVLPPDNADCVGGVAETVKSLTFKVMLALWERVPVSPVITNG